MVNAKRNQPQALDAQRIKNTLNDMRGRMYRQALLQNIAAALFYGLVLLALLFILNRIIPLPVQPLNIGWIIITVAIIVGISISISHRKDLPSVARVVDEKMRLHERLSTAFGLMQTDPKGEFAQLQIRDAAEIVTTLNIAQVSPYRLPKLLKLSAMPLLLIGLSFTIPLFYEVPQPLTDLQQTVLDKTIQNLDEKHVQNLTLQQHIADTVRKLKTATDIDTAQKHLSDLKKEVRKQQSERDIITEATETTQNFHSMKGDQLAAELKMLAEQPEIPPELQAELRDLFQRLAENLPAGPLNDSLNQIQGQSVTPETLQDIVDALEMMEASTDLAQLEAQLTANQKELALAALDIETPGGGIANSDGAPGQDIGKNEVQGSLEGTSNAESLTGADKVENGIDGKDSAPLTGTQTQTLQVDGQQLTLTAKISGDAQSFSDAMTGEVSNNNPTYLPFSDVVLKAQRAYAEAVNNKRIPVRYQAQIKAYLEAVVEKNEK